jgi:hypothetical protein
MIAFFAGWSDLPFRVACVLLDRLNEYYRRKFKGRWHQQTTCPVENDFFGIHFPLVINR